ncbi:HpcH/HpaI aldolase/citrate lyase family protein [Cognatishimia sp. MH4019]|uniref:HpcH/HpaI aldolase family protein n=1 Tax=Cognatishimia sp. MH4019 TaxID=2854030 RepID=UPI001CD77A90|nr:HpcH/HpaI aldolase/citrate lyase family protein [Cognatishimia sp. MH4019]
MPAPANKLKEALLQGAVQKGLWMGLASPTVAELASHAGFDWCLIDAEHGPNDLLSIQNQLQAMNGAPAAPVVRVPVAEDWMLKQVLDLGAQNVLIPMIDTGEEAAKAVAACRYPPHGIRGLGSALARASGYNAISDYPTTSNDQICVMVQAESRAAIDNIDAIAGTEGVDVVFIGPADLSADMGYLGQLDAPEVEEVIAHAISRIRAAGKVAGIVLFNPDDFPRYLDMGAGFLGMGSDVTSLAASLRDLARSV